VCIFLSVYSTLLYKHIDSSLSSILVFLAVFGLEYKSDGVGLASYLLCYWRNGRLEIAQICPKIRRLDSSCYVIYIIWYFGTVYHSYMLELTLRCIAIFDYIHTFTTIKVSIKYMYPRVS
jgi:hypothetical protein